MKKISLGFLMGVCCLMMSISILSSCEKVKGVIGMEDSTEIEKVDTPTVAIDAFPLEIKVGEHPDLLNGVTATIDGKSLKVSVDTTGLDLNKAGEYDVTYLASDTTGVKGKRVIRMRVVDPNHKIVYLTFDDGPSTATPLILDILKQENVHATFFVTAQYPSCFEYIRRASNEGNAIAAHTYTHNFNKIYSSTAAYFEDLDKINAVIEKYTGHKTNIIRFPGGSSNTVFHKYNSDPNFMVNLTKEVQRRGYQYVDWNGDSQDATANGVPVEKLVSSACREISGTKEICILMHDTQAKMTTVQALPAIIKYFKNMGYEFGTLTSTSYICHHGIHPYRQRSGGSKKSSPTSTNTTTKTLPSTKAEQTANPTDANTAATSKQTPAKQAPAKQASAEVKTESHSTSTENKE